ncbi:hypothetical protein FB45DRAFT_99894 [Roridomyces roridus]|nr:hypothetical protein FB45DRAFT_99894 [Roridomyces roridus]
MSLPNETLVAVLDGLPASVLADVARVSRRLNAVAERLLYSAISITDLLSGSSPVPARTLQCCRSILSRPHLVDTIKRLHIRWHGDFRSLSPHALAAACTNVGIALQTLVALEGLDIFLGPANLANVPHNPVHAIERILGSCALPSLRFCSLGAEWSKDVRPYTDILPAFLSTACRLTHLKLSDHHQPILALSHGALPALFYFRGSPYTAASLLPGRPVQYLALIGQDSDVSPENLRQIALTSAPLRSLDLSAMQVRPILLRHISIHLAAPLEILKVRLALRHTLHYALSGIALLAGLSSVLANFPHLLCFDLSPTEIDGGRQANLTEEASLCADWSRACPSLTRIVFPSGNQWRLAGDGSWV